MRKLSIVSIHNDLDTPGGSNDMYDSIRGLSALDELRSSDAGLPQGIAAVAGRSRCMDVRAEQTPVSVCV
jgi:hypothetical protein